MDEASKLVSELHHKLAELDHKVLQYRRDMASQFTKYADDLLRGVPADVSEAVSKTIAASARDYKALGLDSAEIGSQEPYRHPTPTSTATPLAQNGNTTQISSEDPNSRVGTAQASGDAEMEVPDSPHAREKELHGLFTPSYLPLLDSTDRNERRPSNESILLASPKGKEDDLEIIKIDAGTSTTRSPVSPPQLQRPPQRRNTDELSIASSDFSDGVTRRSALRRSSSSSMKQSPRRVRFEVAGEEVLPTSSPRSSEPVIVTDIPATMLLTGDSDEAGSEASEEVEASPRRISSSQALRNLSRSPLVDDGTQWTTVSAPPDGSASVAISNGASRGPSTEDLPMSNGLSYLSVGEEPYSHLGDIPLEGSSQKSSTKAEDASPITTNGDGRPRTIEEDEEEYAETSSDDDDILDMPLRRMKGPPPATGIKSPTEAMSIETTRSPTAADIHSGEGNNMKLRFADQSHEDIFHFDENIDLQRQPGPEPDESEVLPDLELEPEECELAASATEPDENEPRKSTILSQYSQSPARPIARPGARQSISSSSANVVNSYKGHPFSLPVVSPELHAQAESLGDVKMFVGSVDGRSGLDQGDLPSFMSSFGIKSLSGGTPKSMAHRMMLDDLHEAEAGKNKGLRK